MTLRRTSKFELLYLVFGVMVKNRNKRERGGREREREREREGERKLQHDLKNLVAE